VIDASSRMRSHQNQHSSRFALLREANRRLSASLTGRGSLQTLLRSWSEYIRLRDGYRCVACNAKRGRLSAHHICRKTFLPQAQFNTGNGITLCPACHGDAHRGFNGRPDISQPMDAEGGEKIETLSWLYGVLERHARASGQLSDEFYFLSDSTLAIFRRLQGYEETADFPGCRLEQANFIWRVCPLNTLNAVLRANGMPERTEPLLPGITIFYDD
jgi:hypothetical protein